MVNPELVHQELVGQDKAEAIALATTPTPSSEGAGMTHPTPITGSRPQVPLTKRTAVRLAPHPDAPDSRDIDKVRRWLAATPRPWAIDLFSGAGGLSHGLRDAGFSVIVAADSERDALATHRANFPSLTWNGDLARPDEFLAALKHWGIEHVDLLAGGPPCQPFSKAGIPKISSLVRDGSRGAHDSRRDLWWSFFRLMDALSPTAILFENVPDMARSQEGAILVQLLQEMENRGYRTWVQVLEAWRFGVPQHRTRLFVVALKKGMNFRWPEPADCQPTVRDAIGDLPAAPPGQMDNVVRYSGGPISALGQDLRSGLAESDMGLLWDHETRFVRPDDAEAFAMMEEGQTYRDLPERLRRYRADIFDDKYLRLSWSGRSRSITAHLAKDGYWYIHPEQDRTLSVREAARIQTFPDRFRFAGSMISRFTQIGNAVPPMLARAVGQSVHDALDGHTEESVRQLSPARFRSALIRWHHRNVRAYPWRRQSDPWLILMAESCLHRTRADQVASVFDRLVKLAPTDADLLRNRDLFRMASKPLGLSWRVESLIETAQVLVDRHGGIPPNDWPPLRALPGVGDYVAAAVMCFAYGKPTVLLDTNTLRIARRLVGDRKLASWEARVELYRRSGRTGPDAAWNYALLDLGGIVCTARHQACAVCPVSRMCETGQRMAGA